MYNPLECIGLLVIGLVIGAAILCIAYGVIYLAVDYIKFKTVQVWISKCEDKGQLRAVEEGAFDRRREI